MKLTAPESVLGPLVVLYLGLIRPSLPFNQLVLLGEVDPRIRTGQSPS